MNNSNINQVYTLSLLAFYLTEIPFQLYLCSIEEGETIQWTAIYLVEWTYRLFRISNVWDWLHIWSTYRYYLYGVHCTLYSVYCTMYSVQYKIYILQYTIYILFTVHVTWAALFSVSVKPRAEIAVVYQLHCYFKHLTIKSRRTSLSII